jgi:hypothetical protein
VRREGVLAMLVREAPLGHLNETVEEWQQHRVLKPCT